MAKNAANHLHKYKKVDIGAKDNEFLVYKCQMPTCTHYIPLTLAEGKLCICNICNEPMIITKETLTHSSGKPMAKPRCTNCIKRKNATEIEALADFLKDK